MATKTTDRIRVSAKSCVDYIGVDVGDVVIAYSFPFLYQEALKLPHRPFNAGSKQCADVLKSLWKEMIRIASQEYRISLVKAHAGITSRNNRVVCDVEEGHGTAYYRSFLPKTKRRSSSVICIPPHIKHPAVTAHAKKRLDDVRARAGSLSSMAEAAYLRDQATLELKEALQVEELPDELTDGMCDQFLGLEWAQSG